MSAVAWVGYVQRSAPDGENEQTPALTGLPGLIAFLWLLGRFVLRARALLAASPAAGDRWLVLGALGSMADFVVHGLGDNAYFLPDLALAFWLALAVVERVGAASPAGDG